MIPIILYFVKYLTASNIDKKVPNGTLLSISF